MRRFIKSMLPLYFLRLYYRFEVLRYVRVLKRANANLSRGKSIFVIDHFFSQDVKALALANKNYNLIVVDPTKLIRAGHLFFSREVQELNAPYAEADQKNKKSWRYESEIIIDQLSKIANIDCLITPADDFYWIREMIAILKERSVPIVVLDKEGTISPFDFESESQRVKRNAPFISDFALVWSERQKRYWSNKGVDGDRVHVVGQARSDLFYIDQENTVEHYFSEVQPLVTFFSFEDDAYVPMNALGRREFSWLAMKTQSHQKFFELSKKYKNVNFVLKTHPQQPDANELKNKYRSDNFSVISGSTSSNELIRRSQLIIGFQTTGLIEAMFLNRPVIYLCWDANIERVRDNILPFATASGIKIIDSEPEFSQTVSEFIEQGFCGWDFSKEELAQRNRFVQEYFYRPDGQVCNRIFSFLDKVV